MKITNSSVAMASAHHETSFIYKESMTIEAAKSKDVAGAILTLSAEAAGKNLKETMVEYQKQQEEEAKQRRQENEARSMQQMAERLQNQKTSGQFEMSDEYDMKIKMLRQILAALRGEKVPEDCKVKPQEKGGVLDLRSGEFRKIEGVSFDLSAKASVSLGSIEIGTNASGTTWQRITATSGFVGESESTTFASKGLVQTADGRNIDFNVEVSMSRAFMSQIDTLEVQEYIKTDPLMINLDTNIDSVSDQKFFFDLDSDGDEEQISFAGKGSGFLALDKNGDGKINDGFELFGTSSGDGFKDLAAYDEDGNGWIDENDSVFSKLKVWTKDENGNDYLIDLKKADVGAIYLSNADTQFSLKDDENNLNAEIKKTGIYLRESTGAVGSLNHVDLVV
ncbi:MAG: hypothetical protein SOV61_03020 [Lachnospiraceae bacterium]|nr:hypothetical protein [Lachnospiraceae bacterium]